jgi:hypothetical protein
LPPLPDAVVQYGFLTDPIARPDQFTRR